MCWCGVQRPWCREGTPVAPPVPLALLVPTVFLSQCSLWGHVLGAFSAAGTTSCPKLCSSAHHLLLTDRSPFFQKFSVDLRFPVTTEISFGIHCTATPPHFYCLFHGVQLICFLFQHMPVPFPLCHPCSPMPDTGRGTCRLECCHDGGWEHPTHRCCPVRLCAHPRPAVERRCGVRASKWRTTRVSCVCVCVCVCACLRERAVCV